MVTVRIYQFAKDSTSTKNPNLTPGTIVRTFNCDVYEPCSMRQPSFILGGNLAYNSFASSNYAFCVEWNTYYWITDKEFVDGRLVFHCSIDPLTTYRPQILASEQFVIRSASQQNEYIVDTAYSVTAPAEQLRNTVVTEAQGNPFISDINSGIFIMSISSKAAAAGSSLGSNLYISMTPSQMTSFMLELMGTGSYLNVSSSELSSDLVKVILNPIQYIQSLKFFPMKPAAFQQTALSVIPFGWWSVPANATLAFLGTDQTVTRSFNINVPKHPDANQYGQYLNLSPFSSYRLTLPVVGEVDLPDRIGVMDLIQVVMTVDIPTGHAVFRIYSDRNSPAANYLEMSFAADIAIDIPIAQLARDVVSGAQSAVSTIGNAAGAVGIGALLNPGMAVEAAANAVNSSIDTAVAMTKPIPAFMGTAGCLAQYKGIYPSLTNNYHRTAEPNPALFGSPLCASKTLSTLSGMTVCASPHIEIQGAAQEDLEYIETIMARGIKLE